MSMNLKPLGDRLVVEPQAARANHQLQASSCPKPPLKNLSKAK